MARMQFPLVPTAIPGLCRTVSISTSLAARSVAALHLVPPHLPGKPEPVPKPKVLIAGPEPSAFMFGSLCAPACLLQQEC